MVQARPPLDEPAPAGRLPGEITHFRTAIGAIGSSYSKAVPAGETWLIYIAKCRLDTAAPAGVRRLNLWLNQGAGQIVAITGSIVTQAALTSYEYCFGWDMPAGLTSFDSRVTAPLPQLYLVGGGGVSVTFWVTGIQVGDNTNNVQLLYSRWR